MNLESYTQDLSSYRWKNRLLLIEATSVDSKIYRKQMDEFKKSEKGLVERKLKIFSFFRDGFTEDFDATVKPYSQKINQKFKGFEVQLIGLDGGVKLKKNTILKSENLFAMIDGMPMRRRELKAKRNE